MTALTLFYPEKRPATNKWLCRGPMSSISEEAYTPEHITAAVLEALGGRVDLDPCADPDRSFPAAMHYTKEDNGLARPWRGFVYVNPPYGRDIKQWTTKLADELRDGWVKEAVMLVAGRVDTGWWHELHPPTICVIRGRLPFGNHTKPAPFPSVALYFGDNRDRFSAAFRHLGIIYAALD